MQALLRKYLTIPEQIQKPWYFKDTLWEFPRDISNIFMCLHSLNL